MAETMSSPSRPFTPAGQLATEDGPLWSTIKGQLYRSEVAHVKRLVGEGLIQKNKEMWEELASLKLMLTDFQQQNDKLSESIKKKVSFCGSQHRDLLRGQAQMVLADIKSQAESCGHNLEELLPELRDNPGMHDYITGGKDCRRSAGKLDGFGTPPATPSTRPPSSNGMRPVSSGGRSGCSTPDHAGNGLSLPLGRALNLDELGSVAEGIRDALKSEQESLLTAIGEENEQLESEADHRVEHVGRNRAEPSTAELQQFVHKLQELANSPSLRTLSLTGGEPERPAPGGSSVRRLQALIAERRLASPRRVSKPANLFAVPESQTTPTSSGGGGYSAGKPAVAFDPFFDDPMFAAAVSGCIQSEDGLLA